jgi:hypothetical protein
MVGKTSIVFLMIFGNSTYKQTNIPKLLYRTLYLEDLDIQASYTKGNCSSSAEQRE